MSNADFNMDRMRYSKRELDFIFLNLEQKGYEVQSPKNLKHLKHIVRNSRDEQLNQNIFFLPEYCLAPDESIRWFKDDLRAALWFYTFLTIKQRWELSISIENYVFSKDLLLSFDSYQYGCEKQDGWERQKDLVGRHTLWDKKRVIKMAMREYNKHKTSNKHLNWLDRRDQGQLDWAIDYLQQKELLINPSMLLLADAKEGYAQVCASLDALDLHANLEQKLIDGRTAKVKNANSSNSSPIEPSQESELISSKDSRMGANDGNIGVDSVNNTLNHQPNTDAYQTLFGKGGEASEAKIELLKNMRTAWNQKVFRDKKTVKPEKKLKLPHGYEKKLNIVAEAYGENMVTYLKALIDKEYTDVKSDK